ncbi:putative regulatory protein [Agrobacterium sp. ATCC 31749]|uniref:rhizopine catabolism transcriptional regulator MocR n=1 Tax=unclassified Agrobacterium TaxID=2632611 RepID=UPI00020DBE4B|nr:MULTISPECIES: PLP-dependent aminotransferase family protein [unclassified Agrobacterium]EGL62091.1 putative regulatory protein [Agrobacterium sp. ATCC 31749]
MLRNQKASSPTARLPLDALTIDRASRETIQQQIYRSLSDLILRRVLTAGLKLPSSRELSKYLAVSRNTVVRAYEQLNSEGYVETRQGSNTYVIDLPAAAQTPAQTGQRETGQNTSRFLKTFDHVERFEFSEEHISLRPSTPDVSQFPFKTWNRILGRYLVHRSLNLFYYNYNVGYPPLQEAIANYLQAYRGVRCEPYQVIVTNGAQAGLDLLARALLNEGDTLWMEEPGYVNARIVFQAAGAKLTPLNVSEAGWDLSNPPDDLTAIYTTPSCQHPLGLTMLMEQRMRLLEIADRKEAWIIEDDFDSEYRSTGRSIPAMQGHDDYGRTIYVGTFAKTLFPSIRVGFLVVPKSLCEHLKRAAQFCGHHVSLPLQATLADFILEGHFARHLRRMRRLYAQRREAFLQMCTELLGEWLQPFDADVGIQIAFRFLRDVDDAAVARRANEAKLNVIPLSRYAQSETPVHGFLLGYAALDERAMKAYLSKLAEILTRVLGSGQTPAQ